MRASLTCRLAATFISAAFALPALAGHGHYHRSASTAEMPSYAVTAPGDPIHSGGATTADTALAMDVAAALASDPRLDTSTITVSASNGGVSLSGSAETVDQAFVAEQRAREVAGVQSVSGTLSTTGG